MSKETKALDEKDIQPGDYVGTNFRGGTRQGHVQRIATKKEVDQKPKVVRPPKVVFEDQHGHVVAHNPSTLWKDESKSERHSKGEQEDVYKDEDYNEEEDEDYKPPEDEEDEEDKVKAEEIEEAKEELKMRI